MARKRKKDDLANWGETSVAWPIIRDALLFFCGLAGVMHETIISQAERPSLLILFAAMMGLPAFIRADKRNGSGGGD